MMRIAFFTATLSATHGWARYAYELALALTQQEVQIIAFTQPGATLPDELSALDVRPVLPHLVPPTYRAFMARSLWAIPRVRRAVADCDVIHVIAEPYSALAGFVAGDRPLIVTAHGTYLPYTARRRLVGRLYRSIYRRARLIAVSHYTAGKVRDVLPGSNPVVIHNGVHFDRFQVPAPVPEKAGPTILATGGVKPRKGTHVLVDALARIREQMPDARLVVTGRQDDTDYLTQVQQQISRLSLTDACQLVGQIPESDLLGWYQHADVFALPSMRVGARFEGFGLVFLEASACGLPVVGTTGSGVEEAVIDGETGLLVPQNDSTALANAILRLLGDDDLRRTLGAGGRAYAQTQDWGPIAAQIRAVYAQSVGRVDDGS